MDKYSYAKLSEEQLRLLNEAQIKLKSVNYKEIILVAYSKEKD